MINGCLAFKKTFIFKLNKYVKQNVYYSIMQNMCIACRYQMCITCRDQCVLYVEINVYFMSRSMCIVCRDQCVLHVEINVYCMSRSMCIVYEFLSSRFYSIHAYKRKYIMYYSFSFCLCSFHFHFLTLLFCLALTNPVFTPKS